MPKTVHGFGLTTALITVLEDLSETKNKYYLTSGA